MSDPNEKSSHYPSVNCNTPNGYLYTYACHEDEQELCQLELRRMLHTYPSQGYIESQTAVAPERSPFIHHRLDIQCEAESLEQLEKQLGHMDLGSEAGEQSTFKLICLDAERTFSYEEKRQLERRIGRCVQGIAKMKEPEIWLGMAYSSGRWIAGRCEHAESVWLQHNDKPQHYSTALSTRVARAAVNIAVPDPNNRTLIDPCCGIGTVLIEALSMGIHTIGYDLNPLAVTGARENLRYYNMPDIVKIADLRQLEGSYDALILDLPYNLCSVLNDEERLDMLKAAARLSSTQLIISTEAIEASIQAADLHIEDICHIRKGRFTRYLWLCSKS